ncbi:MAG: SpoIIE family protein phosphatase [Spirochaetes bacterium]|jgi:serine phosphatase RsbU (regulator of sigma subunit)|nr:SpoIIE family protein phosphatase [Spirochaetota bacterium]
MENKVQKIELSVVSSINRKINSRMSLGELLSSIMDVAKEITNSEGSSLLLADPKTGDLIFNIVIGDKGDIILGEKVPKGKGIAGTVAETKKPTIVDDVQNDPRFFDEIDKKSSFKTRNILGVPMIVMGEFVGVLEIVNAIGRDCYNEWDLEKAKYIADQAAVAINNRRLYDDLNKRIEELASLYEVSQSISYANKDDDIMNSIIKSLAKAMKVRRASIMLSDKETGKLKIESSFGLPHDVIIDKEKNNFKKTISGHVFSSGDPLLVSDIASDLPDPLLFSGGKYVTESFISIPIMFKNDSIGVLNLADKINGKNFDAFDLRVISTVSIQIADAYQNIINQKNAEKQKRLSQEIDIAAEIQRKILPKVPEKFKRHVLRAYNKPAKVVGGDFYDFFVFDDNKYAILVADISGKGIPAALFMGIARNVVRAERRIDPTPAHLLKNVNNFIYHDSESGMFVTMFYAVIDTHNNLITYGSAGHNNQLLIKGPNKVAYRLKADGKALGLAENQVYEEKVMLFEPGDMLILFTDGVTECLGGVSLDIDKGERRLCEIAFKHIDSGPDALIESIMQNLGNENMDSDFKDDLTIFAIKF